MKRIGLPLLGLFLALGVHAQDIPTQLNGKLVALRGKSALPFAAPDLPKAKYIALYFSAGWCGPCHQFTPDLVKFYNEMKPSHPEFEIVFMSEDQGASAMEKYMSEMSMPWPAMRYSAVKGSRLAKFAGPGIPCLVLLNEKGEVLSHSYVGRQVSRAAQGHGRPEETADRRRERRRAFRCCRSRTDHSRGYDCCDTSRQLDQIAQRHQLGRSLQEKALTRCCRRFALRSAGLRES